MPWYDEGFEAQDVPLAEATRLRIGQKLDG
jgi:hypothetical protein